MPAPTIRLDYFDGTNWVQALTHAGTNAVLRANIEKKLDAASTAELILSNKSKNYSSTTTSKSASDSSQGKLSGIFTELLDCRLRDEETGTMLFRGRVIEEQNQYNLQSGSTIRILLREILSELSDYPLDHIPASLYSIDIESSGQTPDTTKKSGVIQKILSAVSGNFDTDDTSKFEASQVAFTANEQLTGDTNSSGKNILDLSKAGKGQLLRTIHNIAMSEPHASTNNKHFGYDYYVDPNFTSLATTHNPSVDFNYFMRATRPGAGGSTTSDPTKYGLTVEYPSSGWGGQNNFRKAMLSDCDFDSTTSVLYTSVITHYTETNSADSGANSQFEATETFELFPGTITGNLKWSGNRLSYINDSASTNPLLLYRANPTTAINMSGNIDASATALIVDSVTDFVVGQIITVDSEKMTITAINTSTNTFTITRASSSTSAAGHDDDATVTGTVVNPCATLHYQSGTGSSQYVLLANVYDEATTLQFTNETGQDFDPFPTLSSSVRFFLKAGTAASGTASTAINMAGNLGSGHGDTSVVVDDASVFTLNQIITIESEQMLVTGISSNTLTVDRGSASESGYNGTTRAGHNDDVAVVGFYIDATPSTARRKNKLSYSKPFRLQSQTNIARDSVRNEVLNVLDTTSTGQITRARFGTVRYPYVTLEAAAAKVSRSSNVITYASASFTPADGSTAINNPLTFGVKVGMAIAELNSAGTAVTRYSYVSAVSTTTVTYGASDTDTSDGTALDTSNPIAIYLPVEPGHTLRVKNKLWAKDYNVLLNNIKYEVNNGYITCYMSGYGLDVNDAGVPITLPSTKTIDVDFPTQVLPGGTSWAIVGGYMAGGHTSTAADNYKTVKVVSDTGASTVTVITHPDGKSYVLKTGNYDVSGSGNTANEWHTLFLRPLSAQTVSSAPLTNDHQALQVVASARSTGSDTLYSDIEDPKGDIVLGRAKTNLAVGDLSSVESTDANYIGNASLELFSHVGTMPKDSDMVVGGTSGTNVIRVNSAGLQAFQTVSGTQVRAIDINNSAVPRITVGDTELPQNTVQVSTNGILFSNPAQAATRLNESGTVSTTDGTLTVVDGSKFEAGDVVQIATSGTTYGSDPDVHEQIYVVSVSSNDLTVTRGFNETTAVTYASNAFVRGVTGHNEATAIPNTTLHFDHNLSAMAVPTFRDWNGSAFEQARTALNADINASVTTISVNSVSGFRIGHYILVNGAEQMLITGINVSDNDMTVTRAQSGTSGASADSGDDVSLVHNVYGSGTTSIFRYPSVSAATYHQDAMYQSGNNLGIGRWIIVHDGGNITWDEIPKHTSTANFETLQIASRVMFNNLALQAPRFYGSSWGTGTSGSPTHPTYTFSTDLDTGIYQNADSQIDFSVAGSHKGTFNSDGFTVTGDLTVTGAFETDIGGTSSGGTVLLNENFSATDNTLTLKDYTTTLSSTGKKVGLGSSIKQGDLLQLMMPGIAQGNPHELMTVISKTNDTTFVVQRPNGAVSTTIDNESSTATYAADATAIRVSNLSNGSGATWVSIKPYQVLSVSGTDEQLLITAVNTGTKVLTVSRGYNNTTAAGIPDGTSVSVSRTGGFTNRHTGGTGLPLGTTTISEDLDNSETGVDVASASNIAALNHIQIGTEIMRVNSISSNTLTVTRGHQSTTATTHSNGATVTVLDVEVDYGRKVNVGIISAFDHAPMADNSTVSLNPTDYAGGADIVSIDKLYKGAARPSHTFKDDVASGMWLSRPNTGNQLHLSVSDLTYISMGDGTTVGSNHAGDSIWIGKNDKCINANGNTNTLIHSYFHGNITPDIDRAGDSGSFSHDHLLGTTALPWYGGAVVNALSETSDVRQKENIVNLTTGLDIINSLTPIQYNKIGQTNVEFGFSAQDVKTQMLKLGYSENISLYVEETQRMKDGQPTNDESAEEQTFWSLKYTELIGPLVAAIKELKAEIDKLKNG